MPVRSLPIVCLLIGLASLCGCNRSESEAPPEVCILSVSVAKTCCKSSFSFPVTYYGRVEAARQVELSFELLGSLEEVLIDDGSLAKAGQVIARLDTSLLEAERDVLLAQRKIQSILLDRLERGERKEVIAASQADVKRLNVELERAEAEKKRAENVYAGGAISRSDFDRALFAYYDSVYALEQAQQRLNELESGSREEDIEAQKSRVAEVDAQIKRLEVRFEKSMLRAPFDGVCTRRSLDEGSIISAGQTVVEIYESNCLEARFSIPHQDFSKASEATHLTIADVQYQVADARVVSKVDENMRTVDIVMPLKSIPTNQVLPGQTCTMVLRKREEKTCVEIPVTALVSSVRGLWSCYQLIPSDNEDGVYTIAKVDVAVLFTDGNKAVVTCTLPDQAMVVARGVHRVVPGALVRISEICVEQETSESKQPQASRDQPDSPGQSRMRTVTGSSEDGEV